MLYSIVVPVYNEGERLPRTIATIFDFFKNCGHENELIFVNDGSNDKTLELLNSYRKTNQFKIISYQQNMGKGFAIRQGVLAASGDWIIFFDVDLATPLEEFNHLLSFISEGDDLVVGSRRLKGSEIKKSESKIRVFLGQSFTKISNLLVPGVVDFTCGFKCFSKAAAKKIFQLARINRWGFDTEILYIAKLKGIKIKQMPVSWAHDTDSRVKVIRAIASSLKELFQIQFNRIRGLY